MHKPTGLLAKLKWGMYKLLPNRCLAVSLPGTQPSLALTFDDGPHPSYTPAILDLLDEYDIKATFFLIGSNMHAYPDLVKDIVSRGHSIGNHSWKHTQFIDMPLAEQMQEIKQTEQLLQQIDGRTQHLFRPPNGRLKINLFTQLLLQRIPILLWSLNSMDYLYTDVKQWVATFSDQTVANGDIILLHDDSAHTLEGLKILLPRWLQQGFQFVDCATLLLKK